MAAHGAEKLIDLTRSSNAETSANVDSNVQVNSSRFLVLSLMARDVLAIPVTTVASESAFSTSGRILDQFRSSLSPKVAESLIYGQDWLRASPLPIELEARMDELADLESCISQDPDLTSAFTSLLA